MATSNMQQSQAMQLIAPDIAQEQTQLSRRQQLADLLRKQSLEPSGNTETIGGWAIKKSPFEGLSKMAQALSANYVQDQTDTRQLELAKALQERLVSTANGGGAGLSSGDAATAAMSTNSAGPTNQNAATQTQLMAPVSRPADAKYGNQNLLRSLAINALGGDQASGAFWEDQKSTEAGKRGRELGYTLGEDRKNEDQKRFKENYIAPVNARPGSILRDPITNMPMAFNPHVPDGFTPSFDNRGNVTGMNKISGALEAIGGVEEAKTEGVANATNSVVYDASGTPTFSTKGIDLRRAKSALMSANNAPPVQSEITSQSLPPPQFATSNFQGDPASIRMEINQIKDPQERSNAIAAFEAQARKDPNFSSNKQFTPQQMPGTIANADTAQKASAQTMQDSYAGLQAANSSAQSALEAIDKMQGLAGKKSALLAGPLATKTTSLNPDGAEYEKSRANLIALLDKQLGTGGTDAARANNSNSVPDFGKPKSAIADGLGTIKNQLIAQQIKTNFLTSHYQAGDSKKYTDMQNQFDQNISPSMMPILSAQPGPERAAMLQKAAKDPAMRARLEWAAQNGLLK